MENKGKAGNPAPDNLGLSTYPQSYPQKSAALPQVYPQIGGILVDFPPKKSAIRQEISQSKIQYVIFPVDKTVGKVETQKRQNTKGNN